MIKHIFVDLDGVLVDFFNRALEVHGQSHLLEAWPAGESDMAKVFRISKAEFWDQINSTPSFWEKLKPYPWKGPLMASLGKIAATTIATSPNMDPGCAAEKIRWMNKHLGGNFRRFLLGQDKFHMAKPGNVLIDDTEKNVRLFREHGGHAVLFPQPWNANHAFEGDRVEYVLSELELIRAELAAG